MQIEVEQTVLFRNPGDPPPSPHSEEEQRRRNISSDACFAELFKEFGPPNRLMAEDEND